MSISGLLFALLQFHVPEPESIYRHVDLRREKELRVQVRLNSFDFGLARLSGAKEDASANVRMGYDSDFFSGLVEYEKDAEGPQLIIEAEKVRQKRSLLDFGSFRNSCTLSVASGIPLSLDMELGMGNSNIDLSGLSIRELTLSTSGKTIVCFDSPNPIPCKSLNISAQMSVFKGESLGNAGFEVLYFRGSTGMYTLDLRGEFEGRRRVEIMLGIGSLELILPESAGIRLRPTKIRLRSVRGLTETDRGWYQSANWGETDGELIIHIDGSFGIVRIEVAE